MTKKVISMIVACTVFLSMTPIISYAADQRADQCRTVKVGFFDFDGYHEVSENGEKSGCGYEYLQELKKYANWRYEYVYATYDECLELLKAGEIDLLTSASYSEARDAIFDYSETAMGTKTSILTVKSSDDKYVAGEYETLDGIHVGMLAGNTSNDKLEDFSKKHGFSYTYDDSYADAGELCKALQEEKVAAIVTSNLRKTSGERVVAEFAPSPYYAIVKGGDSQLLYELNTAMEKINIVSPTYQSLLYQKYYGAGSGGGIAFSVEEIEYMKDNPELSILVAPSMRPMVVSDADGVLGIVPEIIRKALKPTGMEPDFVICGSQDEYAAKKENVVKYPVIGMVDENIYEAEADNFRLTSPYLSLSYSVITRTGASPDEIIVAAVPGTNLA
ncbi:MAG: transporter substrate-binding domain-containing protein, partial [Anaerovorax sp.]